MDIFELLDKVWERLQQTGRITYRILQMQFQLDEELLQTLKDELFFSHPEIADVEGWGLVWHGETERSAPAQSESLSQTQPPASNTPEHLAEWIWAELQAMESRGATDGERKTITALFADLKGSAALLWASKCFSRWILAHTIP